MSKAKTPQEGKIVRLSKELVIFLDRKRKKNESFDALLRRCFGIPNRRGDDQFLHSYYIIDNGGSPVCFIDESDAKGRAIQLAIRQGKGKTERVIEVREVV